MEIRRIQRTEWHRRSGAGLLLRLGGVVLLALAWLLIMALYRSVHGDMELGVLAYLFALLGFLGASGGATLLILGPHLFDRIEVSARWRSRVEIGRASEPLLHALNRQADRLEPNLPE